MKLCEKEYARQAPAIVRSHLQKAISTEVYICMPQVTREDTGITDNPHSETQIGKYQEYF